MTHRASHRIRPRTLGLLVLFAGVALTAGRASAHVGLLAPNGGEVLPVGSTFTITWKILIAHDLQNWDLWYSTASSFGPWTPIAMDLPPGDPSAGSIHTYDWVVPDDVDASVWVRVRMDNSGADYEDVSDAPFAIVPACPADLDGSGAVDFVDLVELLSTWGPCGVDCPQDLDGSGDVGFGDLVMLLSAWGDCP